MICVLCFSKETIGFEEWLANAASFERKVLKRTTIIYHG